ncbi:hypothetical protein J3A83DRAFT_4192347 [Scleroderma citrinum]
MSMMVKLTHYAESIVLIKKLAGETRAVLFDYIPALLCGRFQIINLWRPIPKHRWVYKNAMDPGDSMLINDSKTPAGTPFRESTELRALVFHGEYYYLYIDKRTHQEVYSNQRNSASFEVQLGETKPLQPCMIATSARGKRERAVGGQASWQVWCRDQKFESRTHQCSDGRSRQTSFGGAMSLNTFLVVMVTLAWAAHAQSPPITTCPIPLCCNQVLNGPTPVPGPPSHPGLPPDPMGPSTDTAVFPIGLNCAPIPSDPPSSWFNYP